MNVINRSLTISQAPPLCLYELNASSLPCHCAIQVLPLDTAVVLTLDALPESFHGDPADRLIVATAKAHSLPMATRDAAIRRARIVPIWKA